MDAKIAEEMLREELSDQQSQLAASLRSALQEQQQQLEAVQAELKSKAGELQAAMKTLEAQTESKVSSSAQFLVFPVPCYNITNFVQLPPCCCCRYQGMEGMEGFWY